MARLRAVWPLLGPALVVVAAAALSLLTSSGLQFQVRYALVLLTIVVALYIFIGISGVLSFGHVSFVAVGAFTTGLLTVSPAQKRTLMPELFPFLAEAQMDPYVALGLAAVVGGAMALLVALPLMRLNGLAAGIATFGVLSITINVLRNWERVGPGVRTMTAIPRGTGLVQATVAALVAMAIAFAYQRSRYGRRLRASREDAYAASATGVDIYRERVVAFALSGAIAGFAGGQLAQLLGSINTDQVYLDLTFVTLAMLVVGGTASLWGAVAGAVVISFINSFLGEAETGLSLGFVELTLPSGTRPLIVSGVMVAVLILRPSGITRGKEMPWPSLPRRTSGARPSSEAGADAEGETAESVAAAGADQRAGEQGGER